MPVVLRVGNRQVSPAAGGPLEQLTPALEDGLQCADQQRFAEAARAGQEVLARVCHQVVNPGRLVDVQKPLIAERLERIDAGGERFHASHYIGNACAGSSCTGASAIRCALSGGRSYERTTNGCAGVRSSAVRRSPAGKPVCATNRRCAQAAPGLRVELDCPGWLQYTCM